MLGDTESDGVVKVGENLVVQVAASRHKGCWWGPSVDRRDKKPAERVALGFPGTEVVVDFKAQFWGETQKWRMAWEYWSDSIGVRGWIHDCFF